MDEDIKFEEIIITPKDYDALKDEDSIHEFKLRKLDELLKGMDPDSEDGEWFRRKALDLIVSYFPQKPKILRVTWKEK